MKKLFSISILLSAMLVFSACKTTNNNAQNAAGSDSATAANAASNGANNTANSNQATTTTTTGGTGASSSKMLITPVTSVTKSNNQKVASNFSWVDKDGTTKSLADYKGKTVMVNFWATWCPPCRAELPDIVKLRNELGPKGFEVIGISVSERVPPGKTVVQLLEEFMSANKMEYPMLYLQVDNEANMKVTSELTTAYGGISGIPSTFIVDKNGNITQNFVGGQSGETFKKAIEAAMKN